MKLDNGYQYEFRVSRLSPFGNVETWKELSQCYIVLSVQCSCSCQIDEYITPFNKSNTVLVLGHSRIRNILSTEVFAFLAFSPARNKTKFASPNFCNPASCSFRATLDPTCRASIAKCCRISSPTIEGENLLPGVVWSHSVGELRQLHLKSKSFLR
jgi:hypothetical protein